MGPGWSVGVVLVLLLAGAVTVAAQWPVCYDQEFPGLCLQRDNNGQEETNKIALGTCYYSLPWQPNSSLPSEIASAPNPKGHENDLVKTLPKCSNEVRRDFQVRTDAVNAECDYKTFLSVTHCGNCWIEICHFHNNLHWNGPEERLCAMDLFSRRMKCYSEWYDRHCGRTADGAPFLVESANGVYAACSSHASRHAAYSLPHTAVLVAVALLFHVLDTSVL